MMDSILEGLVPGLAAAATAIALGYLIRTVRPRARREGEAAVVEYGRPMQLIVVVFWLSVAGGAVAATFVEPADRVVVFSIVACFLLLVLVLHLECFHVRIRFDGQGLRTSSPWRARRVIPWDAITGVTFSQMAQWYVIATRGQGRVRLHLYLSGLESLLTELRNRGFAISKGLKVPSRPDRTG
jgi:hypothetical protein